MGTLVRERPAMRTRPVRHMPFPQVAYPAAHPGDECPACHAGAMCWIANEASTYNYLCEVCGRCWAIGPSGAVRVNPMTCPPCEHRDDCLEGLRRDVASSHWLSAGAR
jgi:hypothetical protein